MAIIWRRDVVGFEELPNQCCFFNVNAKLAVVIFNISYLMSQINLIIKRDLREA